MTAQVYTQAEVDAIVAKVLADARAVVDLTTAQVQTLITNAIAALPPSSGGTPIVVSKTAPAGAADGTVWVAIP